MAKKNRKKSPPEISYKIMGLCILIGGLLLISATIFSHSMKELGIYTIVIGLGIILLFISWILKFITVGLGILEIIISIWKGIKR